MKCVFVSFAPLSLFTPWGRSWPWQAVCYLAMGHSRAALCTEPVLCVLEWTLKHRNYGAELLFLIVRYARSNRVNKTVLVFFLLLSLKGIFLQHTSHVSASEPLSCEAVCFGSWGVG